MAIALTLCAARARTIDRRFKRSGEWPIFYFLNHSKRLKYFSSVLLQNSLSNNVSFDYSTTDYAIYLSLPFALFLRCGHSVLIINQETMTKLQES